MALFSPQKGGLHIYLTIKENRETKIILFSKITQDYTDLTFPANILDLSKSPKLNKGRHH